MQISYFVAFTTGIISFLAPCVLPLLPAYVSMVSGVSLSELKDKDTAKDYRSRILLNSFMYVLGFSLIFTSLGLSASFIGQALFSNREILSQVGGIVIIFFGLLSLAPISFQSAWGKELHIHLPQKWQKAKLIGPFLMGITFALAWTPCVGPILGAIITLAGASGGLVDGMLLLFIYSLGISVPFVLISLTITTSYPLIRKLGPNLRILHELGGILLIVTGLLLVTGYITELSNFFLKIYADSSYYQALLERL